MPHISNGNSSSQYISRFGFGVCVVISPRWIHFVRVHSHSTHTHQMRTKKRNSIFYFRWIITFIQILWTRTDLDKNRPLPTSCCCHRRRCLDATIVELLRVQWCRRKAKKEMFLEITFWINGGRESVHCIRSFIKCKRRDKWKKGEKKSSENCLWALNAESAHYGIVGHFLSLEKKTIHFRRNAKKDAQNGIFSRFLATETPKSN